MLINTIGIVNTIAYSIACRGVRIRSWQRCSWLAGIPPQYGTTPLQVFEDEAHHEIDGIHWFCTKIFAASKVGSEQSIAWALFCTT